MAGGFVNILINNNTIRRSYRDNIFVTSTLNVTITNNKIVGPIFHPAVNLANIDDVTIVDNFVYQANPNTTVLLKMSSAINTYDNITAGVYSTKPRSAFPVSPDWAGLAVVSTLANSNSTAFSAAATKM